MGTMTEMPSSVSTMVPVTLRVLSVSCLVLYVRLRDVSARSGGPGSSWPARSALKQDQHWLILWLKQPDRPVNEMTLMRLMGAVS